MFNNMTSKLKCIKYVIGDNLEKSVEDKKKKNYTGKDKVTK